jgi:hypothetical protein
MDDEAAGGKRAQAPASLPSAATDHAVQRKSNDNKADGPRQEIAVSQRAGNLARRARRRRAQAEKQKVDQSVGRLGRSGTVAP